MVRALESPVCQVTAPTGLDVNVLNTVNTETPGPLKYIEGAVTSTPGTPQTIIDDEAPASGTWRLRSFEASSRAYASFTLIVNGSPLKTAYTSPAQSTVTQPIDPWIEITGSDSVDVVYDQQDGPETDISSRVYYTEH